MKISELLNGPEKWTKEAIARNGDGKPVYLTSPDAVSYCLLGALFKCYEGNNLGKKWNILDKYIKENYKKYANSYSPTVYFNNNEKTTYKDIMKVVKACDL